MKLPDSLESLKTWEDYRVRLKQQLAQLGTEPAAFFVSKDKLEFRIAGKPWRGHAVLSGPKAEEAARKLKGDGLILRRGTCARKGKELAIEGLTPKLAKESERTFKKLRLGYALALGAVGEDAGGGGTDAQAVWKQLKKALAPRIRTAVGDGSDPGLRDRVQTLLAEAARREGAGDWSGATDRFKELAGLLRAGASGASSPPARGGTQPRKQRKRKKTKDVIVEDEDGDVIEVPVSKGDPGISSEQQIVNALQDFEDAIQDYWSNYALGLQNFVDRMVFESDQAARPDHLQAVFKALAEEAFDLAIDHAGEKLGGPWGQVIGAVKASVDAWAKEGERAAEAAGQVKIADYIESVRNGIPKQRDKMIKAVEARRRPLLQHFQALAEDDPAKGRATSDGRVVGAAAKVLIELTRGVAAFKRAIPSPSYFQRKFTVEFADAPNTKRRGKESGTLYLDMQVHVEPGDPDAIALSGLGKAWKLVTSAPSPDKLATSLKRSLEGKKPWQVDLPKRVRMVVMVDAVGFDKRQEGYILFDKDPRKYEVRSNYGEKWFRTVWEMPTFRNKALKVTGLVGGSE